MLRESPSKITRLNPISKETWKGNLKLMASATSESDQEEPKNSK
jgi:hypothetical protein